MKILPFRDSSTAVDWYLRLHSGAQSRGLQARFRRWLAQDQNRRREYERCLLAVELAKHLDSDPDLKPMIEQYADLADRHVRRGGAKWYRGLLRQPVLVASALLVLLAATLVVTGMAPDRYETGIGEQRTIVAEDNSSITLNTDTAIKVDYNRRVRRIWLERGDAFFSVVSDPRRPFEVVAQGRVVRAIGTKFGVSVAGKDYGKVVVTVLEGAVEVRPGGDRTVVAGDVPAPRVRAGESVSYWGNEVVSEVTQADVEAVHSWLEGKLGFDNRPLVEALAEHNRYSRTKIVVGDDELKALRISGVFRIGDTEGLLFLLRESLGLVAVQHEDVIVLLPRQKLREADRPSGSGSGPSG